MWLSLVVLLLALLSPALLIWWIRFDRSLQQGLRPKFSPRRAKNSAMICAAAFVIFGLFLAIEVPSFNKAYASMYMNWDAETSFSIRAFRWPFYIWPLLFLIPALTAYTLARTLHGPWLRILNILSWLAFAATFIVTINWLGRFIFCHEWGCTPFLF
jgi:membrane protease YdiL (CAAX protease family)